ncbi:MAG TPA: monofunctional biosynthetic peptidoglycan transglycosylase [Methylovirgula sp.]|nr:monofunctional biosynthetic peptidoglycan transglycosylase [Methylovirgula sp.]
MVPKPANLGRFGAILRGVLRLVLLLLLLLAGLIIVYRFVTPVSTLMIARMLLHEKVTRQFLPLERMSPNLLAAVVMSEDAHFCRHHGVDWGAMREVIDAGGIGGASRGASTITMQTVKNLFLWPGRSYVRKALEIPLALVLDRVWPKRRILEIYLNIAEWGDGIFGAEAAAQTYFNKSAADLDLHEAALLAAVLPDPYGRSVLHPNWRVTIHARIVERRVRERPGFLSCVK